MVGPRVLIRHMPNYFGDRMNASLIAAATQ
jgi:hypothetical protein